MTYIRCPHCGAKALHVATICPQCRTPLTQNPMEAGPHGLTPCRRCKKLIERDSEICPYCAYHGRRGRRTRRWAAGGAAALVVIVVLGIALYRAGGVPAVGAWLEWATRARSDTIPTVPAAPESIATAPYETPVSPAIAAAPPVAIDTPIRAPAVPRLVTRYTVNWANVRAGRDTDSAVVAVLRPDEPVLVAAPVGGWWAVWREGALVGYVASDLLRTTRQGGDSLQ